MSDNEDKTAGAARIVSQLIRRRRPDLVSYCRTNLAKRPALRAVVKQLNIADSDEWLNEAISLFEMCMKDFGPAVEWHDEVGGLNFSAGLSIADANKILSIIRDGVLQLVWDAADGDGLDGQSASDLVDTVLLAFDRALATQTSAYVRESRRDLAAVNHQLEMRKATVERDLALAELVQQQFIPKGFTSDHFSAAIRYIPTTGVGGDHAGIFTVSPEQIYVTICDVTGHGVAAALAAEVVNSQIRPLLKRTVDTTFQHLIDPVVIVRQLNDLFYREFQPLGMLLSFFIGLIDAEAGTFTYSGAGHPPPILQCCSAHNLKRLDSQNIILGAAEESVIDNGQNTVDIHKGDRLILYTDGIIEANDGKGHMLGIDGLQEIIRKHFETSPEDLANEIINTARGISESQPADDMSLILLHMLGGPEPARS
jgi:serine phosphatase RsbU (regulator of sigma subunit)